MDEFSTARHSSGRHTRGRPFTKGNPGRKSGSRNRATLVAQALLENEKETLLRKAIELAKAGNVPMLSFLLGRILPKERSVLIDLPPLERAGDAVDASAAIIDAVSTGRITPSEGSELTSVVEAHARAINDADVELRMDNLEKKVQQIISELEDTLKAR
jgi:hypothetical protein